MTQKLYYQNSHLQNFEALVISCKEEGGRFAVVLDKTAFFPEGGGQPADTGKLNNIEVLDVRETPAGILHYTAENIPEGTAVLGCIDWDKRFRRMQNHTGEHIVSGLIYKLYGFNNVGFHIGSDGVTVDFDGVLVREELDKIELMANETVVKNAEVKAEYPSAEELKGLDYRSKIDLTEGLRIVTVEDCDRCACCAPHVTRTGEVGIIKFLDFMNYKGGVRISMLCGFDALADYHEKYKSVAAVSAALSAKQSEIFQGVERLKAELAQAKKQMAEIAQRLLDIKIAQLKSEKGNVCVFEPVFDSNCLRRLASAGIELCDGVFAAFSGNDSEGYQYVICSKTADLRAEANNINNAIGGKGGGSASMLQGSASGTKEEIERFFKDFS